MKKITYLVCATLFLVACSGSEFAKETEAVSVGQSTQKNIQLDKETFSQYASKTRFRSLPQGLEFRNRTRANGIEIYSHQRKLGEAVVEKDLWVFHRLPGSSDFIEVFKRWRNDLPDSLPAIEISKAEAESLVEGVVVRSKLMILSPKSNVYPIHPTPENPCWVVRSMQNGLLLISVIDAMSGEDLGRGVSPPSEAFVFSGPYDYTGTCNTTWDDWINNAQTKISAMDYSSDCFNCSSSWDFPSKNEIRSRLQSTSETALLYEIAHGYYGGFINGCDGYDSPEETTPQDIEDWLQGYPAVRFTFLASCDGMCETGPGTLSHAFRKGLNQETATVGYCGMADASCETCWDYTVDWQNWFFDRTAVGASVEEAFESANGIYMDCYSCIRFAGDADLNLVPKLSRENAPPPPRKKHEYEHATQAPEIGGGTY